jgi:hypothetical protein
LTQTNRSAGCDGIRVGERKTCREQTAILSNVCKACGTILEETEHVWCPACQPVERIAKDHGNIAKGAAVLAEARAAGTDPAHGNDAAKKRGASIAEQRRLNREWEASNTPTMTEAEYRERILPGLATVSVKAIARTLGVSEGYARSVRDGEKVPHPRHWTTLSQFKHTTQIHTESKTDGKHQHSERLQFKVGKRRAVSNA